MLTRVRTELHICWIIVLLSSVNLYAQEAFNTDNKFYIVNNGSFQIINPTEGSYSVYISNYDDYNAGGFNTEDNLIYALGSDFNDLYRIDSEGMIAELGGPEDINGNEFPDSTFNAGGFDDQGNLWILANNAFYRIIDVGNLGLFDTPEFETVTSANNVSAEDIVFINEKFYGAFSDSIFIATISLDRTSVLSTETKKVNKLPVNNYGAAYTDSAGRLYVMNDDGEIFLISGYDTPSPQAILLADLPAPGRYDGFSNPNALSAFDQDEDGLLDIDDIDSDGDGLPNIVETGGIDPYTDDDGDGYFIFLDDDDDDSSILNINGTVEEPFDFDSDNIADFLDIDSDGDAINDIYETGSANYDSDNNGRIDLVWADNDNNGLTDQLDPDNGGVAATLIDTDLDGLPDYKDIDSDNDGIIDIIEAQVTLLFLPPSGNDSDFDGLDDSFDKDNGGVEVLPIDTDEDSIPDYIDLNSDNDLVSDYIEAYDIDGDSTVVPKTGTDVDKDGLDDGLDRNLNSFDSQNDFQTPSDFPDNHEPGFGKDWRDKGGVPNITLDTDNSSGGLDNCGVEFDYDQWKDTINIIDEDGIISDLNDDFYPSLTIKVSNIKDPFFEALIFGDNEILLGKSGETITEAIGTTTFNIQYNFSSGIITISNSAGGEIPEDDINLLLKQIRYIHNDQCGATDGTRIFGFTVSDGDSNSNTAESIINVSRLVPAIVAEAVFHPTTAGGTDGSIKFRFYSVPDGNYMLKYNGNKFKSITIVNSVTTLNNLPAGDYNNMYVTVSDCSCAPISVTLYDPFMAELSVIEDGKEATEPTPIHFSVSLDRPNDMGETIEIKFEDLMIGSASSDDDYSAIPNSITLEIPTGEKEASVFLDVIDNDIAEPNETVIGKISNPSTGRVRISAANDTAYIFDNDTARLSVDTIIVNEDAGEISVAVTLDKEVQSSFTVDYSLIDSTATISDDDYYFTSGTLSFDGKTDEKQSFIFTPLADEKVEYDEIVSILLDSISIDSGIELADSSSTITIANDDSTTITLTQEVFQIEESDTTIIWFYILTSSSLGDDITINYSLTGTSVDGIDYIGIPEQLDIPAGIDSFPLQITIIDNLVADGIKEMTMELLEVANNDLIKIEGNNSTTINILDNENPGLSIYSNDELVTTEYGDSTSFTIELTSEPLDDVIITLPNIDNTEGYYNTDNLVFTPLNWNITQEVFIYGKPDREDDGDVTYTFDTFILESDNDPNYNFNMSFNGGTITNIDIDNPPEVINIEDGDTIGYVGSTDFELDGTGTPDSDIEISIIVGEDTIEIATIVDDNGAWSIDPIDISELEDGETLIEIIQTYENGYETETIVTFEIVDDIDADGIPDVEEIGDDPENPLDTDEDGIPDYLDKQEIIVANADSTETYNGLNTVIDIMANDEMLPEEFFIDIIEEPQGGTTIIDEDNRVVEYTSFEDFEGEDYFVYEICDEYGDCDQARVDITVHLTLLAPEIFTPNGDNENDLFTIEGIEDFPENELIVFNRWGNIVYRTFNYSNTWNGKSMTSSSNGDKTLPTGVYFYVLEYGNKRVSGTVYLAK